MPSAVAWLVLVVAAVDCLHFGLGVVLVEVAAAAVVVVVAAAADWAVAVFAEEVAELVSIGIAVVVCSPLENAIAASAALPAPAPAFVAVAVAEHASQLVGLVGLASSGVGVGVGLAAYYVAAAAAVAVGAAPVLAAYVSAAA